MIDVKIEVWTWLLKKTMEKTGQTTEKANVSLCKAPVPKARSPSSRRETEAPQRPVWAKRGPSWAAAHCHIKGNDFSERVYISMRTKIENCGGIDSLPEFCTPDDLLPVFPVSRATLYRMAEQKRIPSLRIGRRVVIPREPLKKWIEQECGIAVKTALGAV